MLFHPCCHKKLWAHQFPALAPGVILFPCICTPPARKASTTPSAPPMTPVVFGCFAKNGNNASFHSLFPIPTCRKKYSGILDAAPGFDSQVNQCPSIGKTASSPDAGLCDPHHRTASLQSRLDKNAAAQATRAGLIQ